MNATGPSADAQPAAPGRQPEGGGRRLMAVAWPAFLAAAVLEMLVFALVDPGELHWLGHPLGLSARAIYSLAFFLFWGVALVACGTTALLLASAADINRPRRPGPR